MKEFIEEIKLYRKNNIHLLINKNIFDEMMLNIINKHTTNFNIYCKKQALMELFDLLDTDSIILFIQN